MLWEWKEELDRRERELELHVVALAQAQARGLHPRANRDELMELVELRGILRDVKVGQIVKASRLATLVRDVSKVLEGLGMSHILGIPRDPCTAGDILGVVDVILECMKEAYDSSDIP
jgi:hypothetical protein